MDLTFVSCIHTGLSAKSMRIVTARLYTYISPFIDEPQQQILTCRDQESVDCLNHLMRIHFWKYCSEIPAVDKAS